MRFQADTVDLDLAGLKLFDQVVGGRCLRARVLDPVVVVIELDVFSCLLDGFLGELEGEEEVLRADCVVPLEGGKISLRLRKSEVRFLRCWRRTFHRHSVPRSPHPMSSSGCPNE